MEPRDEEDRRRYTGCGKKKPECESVEKGGTGCFGEAYFPDGRPRLLRYTSGRNLPLLFKETSSSFFFFFSFFSPQVSLLDFPGHLLDKHSPTHLSSPIFVRPPLFLFEKKPGYENSTCLLAVFVPGYVDVFKQGGGDVFKQGDGW